MDINNFRCIEDGCSIPGYIDGYCLHHYKGEIVQLIVADVCIIPGCVLSPTGESSHYNLCKSHAAKARFYGLSQGQYELMATASKGRCYICQDNSGNSVDHDRSHCDRNGSCGKCVRGILCTPCNTLLGSVRDRAADLMRLRYTGTREPRVYLRAIDYVKSGGLGLSEDPLPEEWYSTVGFTLTVDPLLTAGS